MTPSVVVDMLDELEARGAVRRVPRPEDRRRRVIELTQFGHTLRKQAGLAAHAVDEELLRDLPANQHQDLRAALTQIAAAHGLDFA